MASEEARLVKRCLRGDPQAIRSLVDQFQSEVYGLCVRLVGDRHEAEDVAQETFVRVFRSLKRWDSKRPLRPWIFTIAVNRCRTFLSQRVRRPEVVDYLQDTVVDRPEDHSRELVQEIQAAVRALRPDYRSVFVLFHEQGLPYESISEMLGCPVGTIKTWLHRARTEVLGRLRQRGMVSEVSHEV